MNFDLFTWACQIINFLILCGILWKFLFKPVSGILDKRRSDIEAEFAEAEKREKDAEVARKGLEEDRLRLEEEKAKLLKDARNEVEKKKKDANEALREEMKTEKSRLEAQIKRERTRLLTELGEEMASLVSDLSGRLLQESATASWQRGFVNEFSARLVAMKEDDKSRFLKELDLRGNQATLRTGLPLNKGLKEELKQTLSKHLRENISVTWEEAPSLLAGLEFVVGGVALDMSLYRRLQKGAKRLIEEAKVAAREGSSGD